MTLVPCMVLVDNFENVENSDSTPFILQPWGEIRNCGTPRTQWDHHADHHVTSFLVASARDDWLIEALDDGILHLLFPDTPPSPTLNFPNPMVKILPIMV
jgi:hypothetical protein